MADFKDLTDDELRTKSDLAMTQGVTVEAMLRPKAALDDFNRNSDK